MTLNCVTDIEYNSCDVKHNFQAAFKQKIKCWSNSKDDANLRIRVNETEINQPCSKTCPGRSGASPFFDLLFVI